MTPKIAVIIPSKGYSEYLLKCIDSLAKCDYPNRELIMVDDGIDSLQRETIRARGDVIILESEGRGPSYARNLAAGWTDAQFIAFTDSDCTVASDWLTQLVKVFEEYPSAVSCGGMQCLPDDATAFERHVYFFMQKAGMVTDYVRRSKDDRIAAVSHNPSCNVIYRRSVYLEQGGFLEDLWPGEDVEFDFRLRRKKAGLYFNPKARVYHAKPKTLDRFCRMMYRYGWAQGVLVRRYGFFRAAHAVPFISLAGLFLFLLNPLAGMAVAVLCILGMLAWTRSMQFIMLAWYAACMWNGGFVAGLFKKIK
jgi:GT2 family glycosyltransferase